MNECQWCGMEPRGFKANSYFFWKCESKQKPNGSRIQSDACAEIAKLKGIIADKKVSHEEI